MIREHKLFVFLQAKLILRPIPKAALNLCENEKILRLSSSDKNFEGKFLGSILSLNILVRENAKISKKRPECKLVVQGLYRAAKAAHTNQSFSCPNHTHLDDI